jgi:pimeloyl-ACP methyl ester carboxylesterase
VAVIVVMAVFYLSVRNFESLVDWSPIVTDVSVAVTAALAIGLVAVVVQAFRSRQLRRLVAILWDVVTFWPRANHPLTPPSYGARTVWDLRLRLAALSRTDNTRVVLVAHSQGTVIAAATLLQANMDRERYPLLTFGSPLRRLYAQNFPAYFGSDALRELRDWQQNPAPRWINLWCHTDPIGAWVFDNQNTDVRAALETCVDCRLLDVQPKESEDLRPDPSAPMCGHSGFWTRPEYKAAVDALQSDVLPEDSAPADTSATAPPMEKYL